MATKMRIDQGWIAATICVTVIVVAGVLIERSLPDDETRWAVAIESFMVVCVGILGFAIILGIIEGAQHLWRRRKRGVLDRDRGRVSFQARLWRRWKYNHDRKRKRDDD